MCSQCFSSAYIGSVYKTVILKYCCTKKLENTVIVPLKGIVKIYLSFAFETWFKIGVVGSKQKSAGCLKWDKASTDNPMTYFDTRSIVGLHEGRKKSGLVNVSKYLTFWGHFWDIYRPDIFSLDRLGLLAVFMLMKFWYHFVLTYIMHALHFRLTYDYM